MFGSRVLWQGARLLGRLVVRFILPGIMSAIGAVLSTPLGLAAAALAGAGAIGYFLYKTLFTDTSPDAASNQANAPLVEDLVTEESVIGRAEANMLASLGLVPEELSELATLKLEQTGVEATTYAIKEMKAKPGVATELPGLGTGTYGLPSPTKTAPDKPLKGDAKSRLNAVMRGMDAAGMVDLNERAMFVSQLAHESGNFQYLREIWGPTAAQARYEGRKDLGNIYLGDGFRFRGRGFIQITGRNNYRLAGKYLGIDLESNPDLAADPDIAVKIALWYWRVARPSIPALAKEGNIKAVTKLINGGYNGLQDRINKYYQYRAKLESGILDQSQQVQEAKPSPAVVQREEEKVELKLVEQNARDFNVSQPEVKNKDYLRMGSKLVVVQ